MLASLASFVQLFPITLAQSLIYGLVALGIMLPFRLLNLPDLSSEGTFPFGACVCAALLALGASPVLATLAAVAAGALAGACTATIHLRLRVHSLLAGILVLTMLWSLNLRIMGKSNLPIFGSATIFDLISPRIVQSVALQIAVFGAIVAIIVVVLLWFLRTELGLGLRGVGDNLALAPALGLGVTFYTTAGMAIANALTALAGALVAQLQGYADVAMGFGILVNGLAAVIIGEAIIGTARLWRRIAAPVVGAFVYYQLVSLGLAIGLQPSDLRLATGLFVIATLAIPILAGRSRASGGAL
jgi:putative ABC transport system permease protein